MLAGSRSTTWDGPADAAVVGDGQLCSVATAPTVIVVGPVLVSDSDTGVTACASVQVIAAPATGTMSSEPVNGAPVGRSGW